TGGTRVLRGSEDPGDVSYMELFFDLVYVLAVTRLTELLLGHLSFAGAGETLVLLLALWWAWLDTAWITNPFSPNQVGGRLRLMLRMVLALIMAAALPEAYGDKGLMFAAAYAILQIGRSAFGAFVPREAPALRRNYQRILGWRSTTSLFWLLGAFGHGSVRI